MKHFSKLLVSAFAAFSMVACSEDLPEGGNNNFYPGSEDDKAYIQVDVKLPSAPGSRSETIPGGDGSQSDAGVEVGKDYENNVHTILLVLATPDGGYVAHGLVGGLGTNGNNNPSTAVKPNVKATASISRSNLQAFYDKDNVTLLPEYSEGINVYVICNPLQEMIEVLNKATRFSTEWLDAKYKIKDDVNSAIWAKKSFLMASHDVAKRKLPATFAAWDNYASENSPFDLCGNNENGVDNSLNQTTNYIDVERAAARFDFKDGSELGNNTYDLGKTTADKEVMKVQLVRMSLVNLSKEFFFLRHTSTDGTLAGAMIGGPEYGRYVVDTDAEFKKNEKLIEHAAEFPNYVFYPMFNSEGKIDENQRNLWHNHTLDDVLNGAEQDTDDSWNNPKDGKKPYGDYVIWRYAVENTIPAVEDYQRNGISTGVVFKGKLLSGSNTATKHPKLNTAINGTYTVPMKDGKVNGYVYTVDGKTYPIIYEFQSQIYVGWNDEVMVHAAEYGPGSPLHTAATVAPAGGKSVNELYQALVAAVQENDKAKEEAALAAFRAGATAAGFTLYQASSDDKFNSGYFFYYYYWNRHNDNGMPATMGPMEFGVVRNNVYKLAVTNIKRLGHPRITPNDPDPVTPDTPDEKGDVYLTVSCQVLPWTVRVNNIEF